MNSNLKFVFVDSQSELGNRYFLKFSSVLRFLGYIVQNLPLQQISTLNSDPSFYYKRVIICHYPTVVDCLKKFNLKGKDTIVQFLLDDNIEGPIRKWNWPLYQTVNNLSKLYTNVFALDISQDSGKHTVKDRILAHLGDKVFRICGGGFNLNNDMNITTYPIYTPKEISELVFEVGLIIPKIMDSNFENIKRTLIKRYGKRFTLINDLRKIRKCKILVCLTSEYEKALNIYPDEFNDLILYNVPIVTDLKCQPFENALEGLTFKGVEDICLVLAFISSNYEKFITKTGELINLFAYGYNLNNQTACFAKWLQESIVNELFNVEPLMNRIRHVKSSVIVSNYKRDLKTVFDHIYIVNLEKDVDRRERAVAMMKKHDITDYEIFKAIDGNDHKDILSNVQLQQIDFATNNGKDEHTLRNFGELGCLLSHLNILQDAKEKGYDSVLIFEDDVILANDFVNRFLQSYNKLNKPWHMLYLGVSEKDYYTSEYEYSQGFIQSNYCCGTFAYAVHCRAYDFIINTISQLLKPLDVYYGRDITSRDDIFAIICSPILAIADTTQSHIRDGVDLDVAARQFNWNLRDFGFKERSYVAPSIPSKVINKVDRDEDDTVFSDDMTALHSMFILMKDCPEGSDIIDAQDYDRDKIKTAVVNDLFSMWKVLKETKLSNNTIVIVFDGIEKLVNKNVLKRISACYSGDKGEKVMGTYGGDNDGTKSMDCPVNVKVFGKYRQIDWIFGGIHTFKYELWKKIKEVDLKNNAGEFWEWSVANRAFIYPMLELSHGNFVWIDKKLCVWNKNNEETGINKEQLKEIRALPCYDSD